MWLSLVPLFQYDLPYGPWLLWMIRMVPTAMQMSVLHPWAMSGLFQFYGIMSPGICSGCI
eukprot:7240763-Ditylum_brightwellii.AAC.1